MRNLAETAHQLVGSGRGILAADESVGTMSSRLEAAGVVPSVETRRQYRALLVTAPDLADTVSGVILCEETLRDRTDRHPSSPLFPEACHSLGILPGIKVDTGVTPLALAGGARVTEGLDGLRDRLSEFAALGAAFTKWRAVIEVTTTSPRSLAANAHGLARYAALCQEQGLVPIVEPEVLCEGDHDLDRCAEVTREALATVFAALELSGVDPAGMVLKPNLVTPGLAGPAVTTAAVADRTLEVLLDVVPDAVAGVAFLSGGHPSQEACAYLGEINAMASRRTSRA